MSEQKSNFGLLTIALTTIGIIILTQSQQWGLTIIFTALLFYAGIRVRQKLDEIGAEGFAVGSIMVWLGFFLSGFPIIAFAWNFLNSGTQIILFILGLALIFLGFTTNYYDLNIRLLQAWDKFTSNLGELIQRIRQRLLHSIWTALAVISALLSIIAAFIPDFAELLPNPLNINYGQSVLLLLLMVLFLLIEIRSIVFFTLKSAWETFKVLIRGLLRKMRNIPSTLYEIAKLLSRGLNSLVHQLRALLSQLFANIYILSFGFMLIFGYIGLRTSDSLQIAAAIILLLIGMVNLLVSRPEAIGRRVAGIQQAAYRRSFTLKNLRKSHTGECPRCRTMIKENSSYCPSCGLFIPDCSVCRKPVYAGEPILICSKCEVAGHFEHLERWLGINPTCPNCKQEWTK